MSVLTDCGCFFCRRPCCAGSGSTPAGCMSGLYEACINQRTHAASTPLCMSPHLSIPVCAPAMTFTWSFNILILHHGASVLLSLRRQPRKKWCYLLPQPVSWHFFWAKPSVTYVIVGLHYVLRGTIPTKLLGFDLRSFLCWGRSDYFLVIWECSMPRWMWINLAQKHSAIGRRLNLGWRIWRRAMP